MMQQEKVMVLCGSRLGISVIRDLYFSKQLKAMIVPRHCKDFLQQLQHYIPDLPVLSVSRQDYAETLVKACKKYEITVGLMIGFSYKLPANIVALPANGFYNMHPGPLPSYRGPDPIFQQIKNREKYAAVTLHKVDESFDTGPVVLTDKVFLKPSDTHGMVITKLAELASRMLAILMKIVAMGIPAPARPQDHSLATFYPKQQANDVIINWQTMDALTIVALINACNPWNKGAVTSLGGNLIKLLQAEPVEAGNLDVPPGTIEICAPGKLVVRVQNKQAINIQVVYTEECFMTGDALCNSGVKAGIIFS